MKPVSASDILRKSAPRETVGQTFVHVNRYENLRDHSPASNSRYRSDSVSSLASQKRKVSESDTYDVETQSGRQKISKMDAAEEEEIVILESKISKVSTR